MTAPRRRVACSLLLLAACAARAAAQQPFAPFSAVYDVRAAGLTVGRMERALRVLADGSLQLESLTRATGISALLHRQTISERSTWRSVAGRPQAIEYHYQRRGDRPRDLLTRFDHAAGRILVQRSGSETAIELVPEATDRLAYQAWLMADLAAGASAPSYLVADGAQLKHYAFRLLGEERIDTPAGSYRAVLLQRGAEGEERWTRIWCAPELGYLPVRVDNHEDGGVTTVVLRSYSP